MKHLMDYRAVENRQFVGIVAHQVSAIEMLQVHVKFPSALAQLGFLRIRHNRFLAENCHR